MMSSVNNIETDNNNYIFNSQNDYLLLIHPVMQEIINTKELINQKEERVEYDYYRKKIDYLKEHEIISNIYTSPFVKFLEKEDILYALANTLQISFEVTDACNMSCVYCGYGKLYNNYDQRTNQKMHIEDAYCLLNHMIDLWHSKYNRSENKIVDIAFYGGEPLLNMCFVKKIVDFVENRTCDYRQFSFSMTTNALLLDRYMDFLQEKKFNLLISLDGDCEGSSLRIDKGGNQTFNKVSANIDLLKSKYPEYFKQHINFNSVLHSKNSFSGIYGYIRGRYGKIPRISELNQSGINSQMTEEFKLLYKNSALDFSKDKNHDVIAKDMFVYAPRYINFTHFIRRCTRSVYKNYRDLILQNNQIEKILTGTCIPFSRKIFVTVNGKILPCERIGQNHPLGEVNSEKVTIYFEDIIQLYNNYFDTLKAQCNSCYLSKNCMQCLFYINNLDTQPICGDYMSYTRFSKYLKFNIQQMENHTHEYPRIITDVTLK